MIICIVGKSGSGKSYVCNLLKSYSENIIHLDIDNISHQVLTFPNVVDKLVNTFGNSVLYNNSINRKALANIVFNSKSAMDKLTNITWNQMEILIDNFIENNQSKIILLDWQLLAKTKYFNQANFKVLVQADFNLRMKHAILRDNITEENFLTREKASYTFNKDDFDIIIDNDFSINTDRLVKEFYDKSIVSR